MPITKERLAELKKLCDEVNAMPLRDRDTREFCAAVPELIEEIDRLRSALSSFLNRFDFDKTKQEQNHLACMWCDTGAAGEKLDNKGHDINCPLSIFRAALEGNECSVNIPVCPTNDVED